MAISERISLLIDNENITPSFLERKINASKGVISRSIAKKTDIQSKWVSLIIDNYPHYNASWLLTGKGEMIIPPPHHEGSQFLDKENNSNQCESCESKEQTINDLRETIRSQRTVINLLEDKIEDLQGGNQAQIA